MVIDLDLLYLPDSREQCFFSAVQPCSVVGNVWVKLSLPRPVIQCSDALKIMACLVCGY